MLPSTCGAQTMPVSSASERPMLCRPGPAPGVEAPGVEGHVQAGSPLMRRRSVWTWSLAAGLPSSTPPPTPPWYFHVLYGVIPAHSAELSSSPLAFCWPINSASIKTKCLTPERSRSGDWNVAHMVRSQWVGHCPWATSIQIAVIV